MPIAKAAQVLEKQLAQQQGVLLLAADLMIATYLAESACLRATRLLHDQHNTAQQAVVAVRLYLGINHSSVETKARQLIAELPIEAGEKKIILAGLRRKLRTEIPNLTFWETQLRDATCGQGRYYFE